MGCIRSIKDESRKIDEKIEKTGKLCPIITSINHFSFLIGSLIWSLEFDDLASFGHRKSLLLEVRRSHYDVLNLHRSAGQSLGLWRALQRFPFRMEHGFVFDQSFLCLHAIYLLLLEGLEIDLQVAPQLTDWRDLFVRVYIGPLHSLGGLDGKLHPVL